MGVALHLLFNMTAQISFQALGSFSALGSTIRNSIVLTSSEPLHPSIAVGWWLIKADHSISKGTNAWIILNPHGPIPCQ